MAKLHGKDSDCYGCGGSLSKSGCWLGVKVDVAPDLYVQVCRGRTQSTPAVDCEVKARRKACLCPGCGREWRRLGEICHACREAIARDAGAQAQVNKKVEWWAIAGKKIAPSLSFKTNRDYVYPTEELAELLAAAVAAGRGPVSRDKVRRYVEPDNYIPSCYETHNDDVQFIEITPEAGAALKKFVTRLCEVMQLQYGDGFRDGSNILGRLSIGDKTVQDFERHQDEVERRCGRPEST